MNTSGSTKTVDQIRKRADDEYCRGLRLAQESLCCGEAWKLENGQFTKKNLDAHIESAKADAWHRALHWAANLIEQQPDEPAADVVAAMLDYNQMLRSFAMIASRNGEQTRWEGLYDQIHALLEKHHETWRRYFPPMQPHDEGSIFHQCLVPVQPPTKAAPAVEPVQKYTCEWSLIEDGCNTYNTCVPGEEWAVPDDMEPPNFCCHCGGRVEIMDEQPETKAAVRGRWESTGLCGCTGELTNGERPFACEHGFKTELQNGGAGK